MTRGMAWGEDMAEIAAVMRAEADDRLSTESSLRAEAGRIMRLVVESRWARRASEQSRWPALVDHVDDHVVWRGAIIWGRPVAVVDGRAEDVRELLWIAARGVNPPGPLVGVCGDRLCVAPEHSFPMVLSQFAGACLQAVP